MVTASFEDMPSFRFAPRFSAWSKEFACTCFFDAVRIKFKDEITSLGKYREEKKRWLQHENVVANVRTKTGFGGGQGERLVTARTSTLRLFPSKSLGRDPVSRSLCSQSCTGSKTVGQRRSRSCRHSPDRVPLPTFSRTFHRAAPC